MSLKIYVLTTDSSVQGHPEPLGTKQGKRLTEKKDTQRRMRPGLETNIKSHNTLPKQRKTNKHTKDEV